MPEEPGGSSAAPTLYQTIWVTTGRAMIGDHHDLESVGELELGDTRSRLGLPVAGDGHRHEARLAQASTSGMRASSSAAS